MVSTSYIQQIIYKLGIPQSEMANELGMSRQQLNNIINGRGKFTQEQLANLYNKYNVNLNFLITGEGDMFNSITAYSKTDTEAYESHSKLEMSSLTQREEDIIALVAKGYSNSEISVINNLSVHTVKGHVASIMRKLNAKRRIEIATKYIESKR